MKKVLVMLLMACAGAALADVSVKSVTAQQRYPWNGKVDVVVTIQGDTNEIAQKNAPLLRLIVRLWRLCQSSPSVR